MANINNRISYMYIEYTTAFHMKFKHLFLENIYDSDQAGKFPLVITWAEADMRVEEGNNKCLAVSAKTTYYENRFKVTKKFFEDALQAFFLFPDTNGEDSSNLRLEFVKALLNE